MAGSLPSTQPSTGPSCWPLDGSQVKIYHLTHHPDCHGSALQFYVPQAPLVPPNAHVSTSPQSLPNYVQVLHTRWHIKNHKPAEVHRLHKGKTKIQTQRHKHTPNSWGLHISSHSLHGSGLSQSPEPSGSQTRSEEGEGFLQLGPGPCTVLNELPQLQPPTPTMVPYQPLQPWG